jgi:hypothetical protein
MPPKGSVKPYNPYHPGFWFAVLVAATFAFGLGIERLSDESPLFIYVLYVGPVILAGLTAVWMSHQFRRKGWLRFVIPFFVAGLVLSFGFAFVH